jgi:hypothetical protein
MIDMENSWLLHAKMKGNQPERKAINYKRSPSEPKFYNQVEFLSLPAHPSSGEVPWVNILDQRPPDPTTSEASL